MRPLLFSLLALLSVINSEPAEKEDTPRRVEQLLDWVAASDCRFLRNGSEHTGKEAAQHMRRKYNHFKSDIATPEQFIEKCGAKSELSGKEYRVKLPNNQTVAARTWMLALLKELRDNDRKPSGKTSAD